jgi:hypothetical protein
MLSQPQRLRQLAVYVLLAWLFGLATGVVNACVARSDASPAAHSVAHAVAVQAPAFDAVAQEPMDDEQGCDHNRPPCERLCDGPSAVTQAEKHQSNPLSGFWLAPPVPSFHFPRLAVLNGLAAGAEPGWPASIPIPIAFLRLTL